MSIIEFEIKNPKKKLEFYEQLHKENITRIEKLRKEKKQLKEVINELNEALNNIDDNIMETCEVYDVNGIELKKILNKIKEN